MICASCGTHLPPNAHFCSRCGTVITPQTTIADRVTRHLPTLGVLWLIYACLRVVKGVTGAFIFHGYFHHHGVFAPWAADAWPHPFVFAILPIVWTSLLLSVAAAGITAYALLTRQPWGRTVAIVFAVFALLHPLLGTALGIYTLWVLVPRDSAVSYSNVTYTQSHP